MPPKKRAQVVEQNPLDEEQRSATSEHQAPHDEETRSVVSEHQNTLDNILGLLREQTNEIRALRERIRELENDRSITPPARPSSPALSTRSDESESSVSSDDSDASVNSDSSVNSDESESPVKTRARDPKVTPPDLFYGKISEFQNFVAQCTLVLTMCPNTYNTNKKRVFFVISNLRGTPLSWARKIITNKKHRLRKNYKAFMAALTNIYGDRAYELECEDRLNNLVQTGSAASYAQTFQSLAIPLGIDNKAQCIMFYGGLNLEVKKAITIAGRAKKIQKLIDQAIHLDQMLYQQTRRQKRESQDDSSHPNKRRQNDRTRTNTNTNTTSNSGSPIIPNASRGSISDTFSSHFRPPLTEDEKERRRQNNLCIYCADPKHAVETCPQVLKKNASVSNPNANKPSVSNFNNSSVPLLYPIPARPSSAPPRSENWRSQPPRM